MNTVKNQVESFFSQYPQVTFTKGKMIINASDAISSIYYIKKGLVRLYIITPDGDEITAHLFKESTYFPMMVALSSMKNKYFFEAQTEVIAHKALTEEVKKFIYSNQDVLADLTHRFADGIMGMLSKTENLMHKDAYTKVASLLLHLAERYSEKDEKGTIIIQLSHEEIASMLGVQRETVSRQIEKLQKSNVLRISNRKITITSLEKFKEHVGSLT